MKHLASVFLLSVLVSACNTHVPKGDAQSGQSEIKIIEEVVGDNFNQAPNYKSRRLTLVYPHQRNWGWITLEGRDAEVLFDTLKIKPEQTKGTPDWNPGELKRAQHVSCYKQESRHDLSIKIFGCTLYVNYRNGTLEDQVNERLVKKGSGKGLQANYTSDLLSMSVEEKTALITLKGLDAKALYKALDIQEHLTTKKGVDFDHKQNAFECFHELDNETYRCLIKIDYRKGVVVTDS